MCVVSAHPRSLGLIIRPRKIYGIKADMTNGPRKLSGPYLLSAHEQILAHVWMVVQNRLDQRNMWWCQHNTSWESMLNLWAPCLACTCQEMQWRERWNGYRGAKLPVPVYFCLRRIEIMKLCLSACACQCGNIGKKLSARTIWKKSLMTYMLR